MTSTKTPRSMYIMVTDTFSTPRLKFAWVALLLAADAPGFFLFYFLFCVLCVCVSVTVCVSVSVSVFVCMCVFAPSCLICSSRRAKAIKNTISGHSPGLPAVILCCESAQCCSSQMTNACFTAPSWCQGKQRQVRFELITSALAPNTAGRSSVLMDSGTELKKEVPIAEPSVNCRKRMAKAYVMIA